MSAAAPQPADAAPIGPGRLVLVVGPSGAGKDTIIAGARAACRENATIVFPRRVVTRPVSTAEDHDSLTEIAFESAVLNGEFALWWTAHGLRYGIPRHADDDIAASRTIVCNVSRAIVADARARYAQIAVVLVTAPLDVLAERLAGRARTSDGNLSQRIQRNDAFADFQADVVIENTGASEFAVRRLIEVIRGGTPR
jgi:ribose 1,5-bisphosphokinase